MNAISIGRIVAVATVVAGASWAWGQGRPPTTEQLGRDPGALRQEAEQNQSRQLQQQQDASQQQRDQSYNDALRQQNARAAGNAAQGRAVLQSWQRRPPLAPAQNALLGRWDSLGVGQRQAAGVPPEMAQAVAALMGGITGGLCDSMLGRGPIEFRPGGVVAIGPDGRERTLYRAEYRGEGSRVVVLPQGGTSFTHMIIDFNGPNRATVAAVGCVLTRHGGATIAAAGAFQAPSAKAWSLIGSSPVRGGADLYVARQEITRSGNSAQMWDLWDFRNLQTIDGKRFLSARSRYEYDCVGTRRRMVATSGHSGHMAQGALVASDNSVLPWEAIEADGPRHEEWKVACAKG